jgi:hypothetical protein
LHNHIPVENGPDIRGKEDSQAVAAVAERAPALNMDIAVERAPALNMDIAAEARLRA